jgi:hypothetical protein
MRKKGSGRTKGAGSFVKVTLGELNRVLRKDAVVIINRRYAEMVGLTNDQFVATTENIQSVATQVDIQEIDLDEQKPIGIQATDW